MHKPRAEQTADMTWEFSHTKNGEPQYDCRAESSWDSETFASYVEHCEKIGYFEHWKHEDGSQMTPEEVYDEIMKIHIPAWSLHRLIEMMPQCIYHKNLACFLFIDQSVYVEYRNNLFGASQTIVEQFMKSNLWENLIDCISWLIKQGYFNKEYLV